jgi:hypothetical protein
MAPFSLVGITQLFYYLRKVMFCARPAKFIYSVHALAVHADTAHADVMHVHLVHAHALYVINLWINSETPTAATITKAVLLYSGILNQLITVG